MLQLESSLRALRMIMIICRIIIKRQVAVGSRPADQCAVLLLLLLLLLLLWSHLSLPLSFFLFVAVCVGAVGTMRVELIGHFTPCMTDI